MVKLGFLLQGMIATVDMMWAKQYSKLISFNPPNHSRPWIARIISILCMGKLRHRGVNLSRWHDVKSLD